MKIKLNWSKIFMDFYPYNLVTQFKKVSLPFYIGFSFLLFFLVQNLQPLLLSKTVSIGDVFTFYFLFPLIYPLLLIGLLLSSIHILRHNNPFILYYINFKHFLLYLVNLGMIAFTLLFLAIYAFFMNSVLSLV